MSGVPVSDVTYVSVKRGWALAEGRLLSTTDGGNTWSDLPSPPVGVHQLSFADDQVGYSWNAAAAGPLWTTNNGGQTWERGQLDEVRALVSAEGFVWALAGEVPYPGVWRAAVGSNDFRKLGVTPNRSASLDVRGKTAYVLGVSANAPVEPSLDVWRSGSTAVANQALPCGEGHIPSAGLGVSAAGDVYLVCELNEEAHRVVAYRSTNGARSWNAAPVPPEAVQDVEVLQERVFAWGRDLHVFTGDRWSRSLKGPASGNGFASVAFQDESRGVALSRDGVMYKTEDAGVRWTVERFAR